MMPVVGVGALVGNLEMKELRINLVINNRERIMLQSDMRERPARIAALKLGEVLNLGVFDCTGSENVWLRKRKNQ